MVADARLRAATMGCDAILINSIDRRRGKYNTMSVQAGCVVYTEPPHAERPPSAPPPLAPRPD
jgi:hypothetical protein